jgi:hypothetical protein
MWMWVATKGFISMVLACFTSGGSLGQPTTIDQGSPPRTIVWAKQGRVFDVLITLMLT